MNKTAKKLSFDLSRRDGHFKILNATNGGPWHKRHANDQLRGNFKAYQAARIPYSRNHDSAINSRYAHDITLIFPDFNADVNDPASYDFACTDESILCTLDAGTETFFRLGQSIEHQIKKHGTLPPKDFHKWAQICEHVIRHYNEGWADGFNLNIQYWEIWNEPDLDPDDSTHKRCWGGTKLQFFDFYEIAAKHLKSCFPHLKIGGPALAWNLTWMDEFLTEVNKRNIPLDFFSWHGYFKEPFQMVEKADQRKDILKKHGLGNIEVILDEWNYIRGWVEDFKYSIMAIHGIKGAAFMMGCISEAQRSDAVDILMYYDTRPSAFCGAFDFYSHDPLNGYYPLAWYGKFYDMDTYVKCNSAIQNLYTLCGVDKNGKALCVITHYSENDDTPAETVQIDFGRTGTFEVYLLDDEHDAELITTTGDLTFNMKCHSCILLKEV